MKTFKGGHYETKDKYSSSRARVINFTNFAKYFNFFAALRFKGDSSSVARGAKKRGAQFLFQRLQPNNR
jgi:hypothetical protein